MFSYNESDPQRHLVANILKHQGKGRHVVTSAAHAHGVGVYIFKYQRLEKRLAHMKTRFTLITKHIWGSISSLTI